MDWFHGFHDDLPEPYSPSVRLRTLHDQVMRNGIDVDRAIAAIPKSAEGFKSLSAGFWYFGFLPNYVLWFFLRRVVLSWRFVSHALLSGYVFRLVLLLFRRRQRGLATPALAVDSETRTSSQDPESSKGLPGFGMENVLSEQQWLVYPYGLIINEVPMLAGGSDDVVLREIDYLWNAQIPQEEYDLLRTMHRSILDNQNLRIALSNVVNGLNPHSLRESIFQIELCYWSLIGIVLSDKKNAVKVLNRYYLHGHV